MSLFSSGCNYGKLKTNLRLTINRLKLLEKKKTELAMKARKEIADYIAAGKIERARIRVEQIIREDYLVEAMEIVEMYCDLLIARFGLFQTQSKVDPGLEEAISTLIWCSPRLDSDVQELKVVHEQLRLKYGKEYAMACMNNSLGTVSLKVMQKLNMTSPAYSLIEMYLMEIAKSFEVTFDPNPQYMEGKGSGGGGGGGGGAGLISFDPTDVPSVPQAAAFEPSQMPWTQPFTYPSIAPYPIYSEGVPADAPPLPLKQPNEVNNGPPPPLPSQPPVADPYVNRPPPPYDSKYVQDSMSAPKPGSVEPTAPYGNNELHLPNLPVYAQNSNRKDSFSDDSFGDDNEQEQQPAAPNPTQVDLDDLSRRFADLKRQN